MKIVIACMVAFISAMIFVKKTNMLKASKYKGRLLVYMCSFITMFVLGATYFLLMFLSVSYYNNMNFKINNSNQYIIYSNISQPLDKERYYYYEVDFRKKRIIMRYDTSKSEGVYKGSIIKENVDTIQEIVEEVVNNDDNLKEINIEDKQEFFRNEVQIFFSIKAHDGKIYYVRDWQKSKELLELLSDYEDKVSL